MPHIEEKIHRGGARRSGRTPATWEGFHPNVLGSLVIRLSQLGYGVLFGTTSDGGALTLSVYMGEVRRSVYLKAGATPDKLFREVARVLKLDSRSPRALQKPQRALEPPPAAMQGEGTPFMDRLREQVLLGLPEHFKKVIPTHEWDGRKWVLTKPEDSTTIV